MENQSANSLHKLLVVSLSWKVVVVGHYNEFGIKRMAGREEFVCFPIRCSVVGHYNEYFDRLSTGLE